MKEHYIGKIASFEEINISRTTGETGADGRKIFPKDSEIEAYEGKDCFLKLIKFMLEDLRLKGYIRAMPGIGSDEEKNKRI